MARLGPASALQVTGECLEVQEGEVNGEAVFTLKRSVEVHSLYDHRCVHSWPLGSADHVTCPTHFHRAMGKYCAVKNGSELLLWTSEDKSLPSHPQALPSSPLALLTPSLPHCLVTVDAAGTVAMLTVEGGGVRVVSEVVIGRRRTRHKQLQVLKSVVCDVGGRECVVVMCGGVVCVCAVDESGLTITAMATLQLSAKITHGAMMTVCGERLLVGGSDGALFTCDLGCNSSHPHPLTSSPSTPHSLITGLSSNHFAVVEPGGVVSLRDTTYGTCQASMETGFHSITMLWYVYGHIVMCGHEGVRVCRVNGVDEMSLATVLGQRTTPPQEALLVTPKWVAPDQPCADWRSEVAASSSDEVSRIRQLCDPSKTPTLDAVMAIFPSPLTLNSLAYSLVVRRLLMEKEFWAHLALVELVKCGAVAGSLIGELVTRALEHKDWPLIVVALHCSPDLPEDILVFLLHHTLELPEVVESYGESLRRDVILWAALAVPYSDSLLQQPLSQLPFSVVLSLLQFLRPHVSVASLSSPPPLPYPQLLDWLSVLLDSHWTALALSPQARDILKNYKHTTFHQMLFCENLSAVQNMLKAAQNPYPRQLHDQWKFCIERIDLTI